jgi:hypothetical protein
VLVASVAFTPATEVEGISPFSSLPVPFPAADKMGEETMFRSVPRCVMFPREVNTGGTGAFLLSSCTGGGREVFPPTPVVLGFMPLTNRVCQCKCEDLYVQDRRASVSLCDLRRCQNIVCLPHKVQARAHKDGVGSGRGIVREVDNSCSSNPSCYNWLIISRQLL